MVLKHGLGAGCYTFSPQKRLKIPNHDLGVDRYAFSAEMG